MTDTISMLRLASKMPMDPRHRELLLVAADEMERLRSALKEAMEWNWIDADVPPQVVAKCEDALPPNAE